MSFWERNTVILGFGSLIAGSYYAALVILQSLALGHVAPPDLGTLISYIVLQVAVSVAGIAISATRASRSGDLVGLRGGMDERDQIVKTRSEAGASHVVAAAVVCALIGWFFHHSPNLLFHTVLAGLIVGELARAVMQLLNYRQPV